MLTGREGGMFLNAKYQWFVINYRHVIKICDHRKGFPAKEISQSDHSRGSGSHSPHVRDGRCWDRSPFTSRGCTEPTAASLESLLTPPSLRRGFPGRVSDVPFHGTIYSRLSNTETARAGASEEDPEQRNPHSLLHPHSPSRVQVSSLPNLALPPEPSAPAVSPSVHSPGRWHRSLCAW